MSKVKPPDDKTPHFSSSSCCILHDFYKSASLNPKKIAIIHAHGGAQLSAQFTRTLAQNPTPEDNNNNLFQDLLAKNTTSSNPPMYHGDECFTFSEIVAAIDSVSSRIRTVIHGGHDPYLIKPTTDNLNNQSLSVKFNPPSVDYLAEHHNVYTPRILGIYMVPSVEYIIAVFSVLRCGEAFLPLDPSWPKQRILSVVSSSNVELIIGGLSSVEGGSYCIDRAHWLVECSTCPVLCISAKVDVRDPFSSSNLPWPCENESLRWFCYLMYTSGSTGKPKGVCGTEKGLLNRLLWMQGLYPLHGEEILLFKTSVSFIDHLQEFLAPLLASCTLVVPPFDELKSRLSSIVDYLQEYSITRLVAVPSVMRVTLPAFQSRCSRRVQDSLKLLVLSGEILHLSLWNMLTELLPRTAILNLYGSTEVSGDCTYFDCKRLPAILESEGLNSIPIGIPISECEVLLLGEDESSEGELLVSGACVACGYFDDEPIKNLDYVKVLQESSFGYSRTGKEIQYYFKTGDFARRLESGDLVFLGRKDRIIKVNGQRISLEEIEYTLREHPYVVDAAVISRECQEGVPLLEGYLVIKARNEIDQDFCTSIRSWMIDKVPLAMIPNNFFCTQSLPMSSTGKVDYSLLANLRSSKPSAKDDIEDVQSSDTLQLIKKAFCDALIVEKVSDDDDFFAMGGDSISAAHASHSIGIDMRLLYTFTSPLKLQMALIEQGVSHKRVKLMVPHPKEHPVEPERSMPLLVNSETLNTEPHDKLLNILCNRNPENHPIEVLQIDTSITSGNVSHTDLDLWSSSSVPMTCSFSRGNRSMHGEDYKYNSFCKPTWSQEISWNKYGNMHESWKVHLESCVDASPLLVFRQNNIYVYIGSHSYKFLCIDAKSGSVQWEVKLEGRVECSAAILDDFSQVIVGCYKGNIYFLDSSNGKLFWTFQTGGEVKSQPLVDKCRHLVWCGSYDHNIYALDYRDYCCIYKLPCGGSIYGSPAIDEMHDKLYVAATTGFLTAISIKAMPFTKQWLQDLGAPVFGSLSVNCYNGNVICCLVSGNVIALDANGSIIWRAKTGGPIFAGPCISHVIPSQVLICSRNGGIYSFKLETGDLLWQYNIKDPITSSAYVDEHLHLVSDPVHLSERLICVCGSSGSVHVLRISSEADGERNQPHKIVVQEFARLNLQGDIFSSPVMMGGRIFVGCRDDYVHCIEL